jgi:hypothetical protein
MRAQATWIAAVAAMAIGFCEVRAAGELQRAEQLLEEMEYQQALAKARRAIGAGGLGPRGLVQAYRIQGMCQAGLGRTEASMQAFRHLLAVDPEFRLSTDISPRLSGGFYQAVAYTKNLRPITLEHRPPEAPAGRALSVELQADPLGMVRSLRLVYAIGGAADQTQEVAVEGLGPIALELLDPPGDESIAYYFEALDAHGNVLARIGSVDDRLRLTGAPPTAVAAGPAPPADPPAAEGQSPEPQPVAAAGDWHAPPAAEEDSGAWFTSWWFWTTVGVVVAGATVGTALAVSGGGGGGARDYVIEVR